MTKWQKFFSALGRFFINLFTKNILLKVAAFLFAVLLWGYVLSIENPEYVKRVRDVEIGIIGENSLNSRGLMLLTRDTGMTDVDVLCRINKHSELDASRVTCTVDLSNRGITLDEDEDSKEVSVDVKASVPTEYGTVQSLTTNSITLTIAKISTRSDVQISPKYTGSLPEGFTVEVLNSLSLSMTGEKSALDKVVRGEVTIDLNDFPINDPQTLANTYNRVLPVQFYDASNKRLDDIRSSNGETFSVNVRVLIRAYKEVEIEPSIEMLEEGYTWRYVLSRSKMIIYGDRALLDTIDSIKTETIAATPAMTNTPMSAVLIIPDGVETSAGFSKAITVTLSVEELTDTKTYDIPIDYVNIRKESSLSADAPKTVTIKVTGPLSALETFDPEWVKATVDLNGYTMGELDMPVRYDIDSKASWVTVEHPTETVSFELSGPVEEEAPAEE